LLYHAYEMTHAAMGPFRAAARLSHEALTSPLNPVSSWYPNRASAAALEMFINATRRYAKPEFEIDTIEVDGAPAEIREKVVLSRPFCDLLHFERHSTAAKKRSDPKVLIVAPLSGHYATLLRGTVKAMLPEHDVYITDWRDARDVPLSAGGFDLDDYTDYIIEFCQHLAQDGERPALMAVCQPGIPVTVATVLMAADNDPARPASVTLMGSPIDTARNPKQPNELAVYPGFLQLSGFMSMNFDRHMDAHARQFGHLIRGDGDSAAQHRKFYDEYLAVMDMTAEFYLQTIERVFQKRLLATGEYYYRDRLIDPSAVTDVAFQTIEGEKDDITGLDQTDAAHDLLVSLPDEKRDRFVCPKVGHYGVFNGSRWREIIQPRIAEFIRQHLA